MGYMKNTRHINAINSYTSMHEIKKGIKLGKITEYKLIEYSLLLNFENEDYLIKNKIIEQKDISKYLSQMSADTETKLEIKVGGLEMQIAFLQANAEAENQIKKLNNSI